MNGKDTVRGDYRRKRKSLKDDPSNPYDVYKGEGWINWGDWLGTGAIATQRLKYRPFKQARAFVCRLALKSRSEWIKYCKGKLHGKGKKPKNIPASPYRTYKDKGWVSMGDWLGTTD